MLTLTKYKNQSATNKEQQIQKLNSVLEKGQSMKKIMVKHNIELKAHNWTLQTKIITERKISKEI